VPDDPAAGVEALAALAGPTRLSALGVPEDDLPGLAADAAQRGGNRANPQPATPDEIERLMHEVF
jgi:alcohol dehydrogenase class IV